MAQLGIAVTKDIIDQQAGYQIVQLRQAFKACAEFKEQFLDGVAASDGNETYLKTIPLGTQTEADRYTPAQIQQLRDLYTAIDQLWQVAQGKLAVPAAVNFFFNAPLVIGTNVH